MQRITAKQGQWLGDVTLAATGSLGSLLRDAVSNGIAPTDELAAGGELAIADVADEQVKAYFEANNINPATAD